MKIIRIKCGLGNQMFQYALYKQLEYMGQDVKLDISFINNNSEHNGYELDRVFHVKPQYASAEELEYCQRKNGGLYGEIRSRLIAENCFREIERFINWDLFYLDNIIIDGYWQNPVYFKGIESIIKNEFRFDEPIDNQNKYYKDEIISNNSVSVHIRRNDYLSNGFKDYYGHICDINYYNMAIDNIKKKERTPIFFVFSDDISWVKKNLHIPNAVYIEGNEGRNAYLDMYLMSLCKHNIIANSTFSWWAAWLNDNKEKMVLMPHQWCKSKRRYKNALVLSEWKKI